MQKLQIKDRLAKLLAGENIIVEHRQVSTAAFDVEQRILTLPMWVMDSSAAYDMLIGHEVGHALYTPLSELEEFMTNRNTYLGGKYKDVEFSNMNIIEDIRIEKMIHKKFPGFRKIFNKGYSDLHAMDFFSLQGRDVDQMSFVDRLNLHFKIGNEIVIKFTDEELEMVESIKDNVNTFEDVLEYCLKIKSLKDTKQSETLGDLSSTNLSDLDDQFFEKDIVNGDSDDQDQQYDPQSESSNPSGVTNNSMDDEEVEDDSSEYTNNTQPNTQDSFNNKLKDLIDTTAQSLTYINIPNVNVDKIMVSPEKIAEECKNYYASWEDYNYFDKYTEFKKESQSSVNFMIKGFQSKKSADEYARTQSSLTGVIDTKKLHTYKFNENIFKQVQIIKEGQNHGMIFLLDWSGSMQDCILETTKQLLQLVWFCRKQNIPFDVYAFSNCWDKYCKNPDISKFDVNTNVLQTPKKNDIKIDPMLSLLNFISSSRSAKEFDEDCRNLFVISYLSQCRHGYGYPVALSMSSTPLNSTLITLRKLIPQFYKKTKVDKLSTIILTDGESDYLTRYCSYKDSPIMSKYRQDGNSDLYESAVFRCVIRDPELGCVYPEISERSYSDGLDNATGSLLQNLKDNFPDMNLIGIRLVPSKESQRFLSGYVTDMASRANWAKDRNINIKDTPYDMLYGIATSILNKDTSMEIPKDASIAQINNVIKKSLKAKNANRKMLSSFIETIA